jgi:hypothetical protein
MKLRQISVFLQNREGRLAQISRVLCDAKINIRALSLADTSDFGIMRMLVDRTDDAITALESAGFTVQGTDVTAVEVEDEPGGLSRIMELLVHADCNVEYMYGFLERKKENAILVFRFDNPGYAIEVLQKANVKVFSEEELAQM